MRLIGQITTNNQQKHIKLPPFGRVGVGVYKSDAAYFVL